MHRECRAKLATQRHIARHIARSPHRPVTTSPGHHSTLQPSSRSQALRARAPAPACHLRLGAQARFLAVFRKHQCRCCRSPSPPVDARSRRSRCFRTVCVFRGAERSEGEWLTRCFDVAHVAVTHSRGLLLTWFGCARYQSTVLRSPSSNATFSTQPSAASLVQLIV